MVSETDTTDLDGLIVGRVDPHIYAFTTNTIPNYLKVGDTYRPVSVRLKEWEKAFPNLNKEYEHKAIIDNKTYFRDYSVHRYLENDLHKERLKRSDLSDENIPFSREFFKGTVSSDVDEAIDDIKRSYEENDGKYSFYDVKEGLPKAYHYERGADWELRPNQQKVVDNFCHAVGNGRTNLLMYAVMRFGKSFTALCCALAMQAELVVVVSGKADVREEWKKTVESAGNFREYTFLDSDKLGEDDHIIKSSRENHEKLVIFLTLQDLQGDGIKVKHKELFETPIDLLIVDETHFGARAPEWSQVLKNPAHEDLESDRVDAREVDEVVKKLHARIRLHLSGTPYRILMGDEFKREDIIAFVQFSDIVREQEQWDEEHLKDDEEEWDNPYFGFPQMLRFAFNPNDSSRRRLAELQEKGISASLSTLFEPVTTRDDKQGRHKRFKNEREVLDFLNVIDGSEHDDQVLGFLDYEKIKEGKMCRHMVMVLPHRASCDAMEKLIKDHQEQFKNLNEYEIINIAGFDASSEFKTVIDVKNKVKECEGKNQKTLTLTVNRMLTGSTVEEWDTMLFLKDTASPQEYDQAIFRLQNQYIRTAFNKETGREIKVNMKPQTLLVDFSPNRLFKMQEQKSLIYNVNTEKNGNSQLKERIAEELRISPVVVMNKNKIQRVEATDIMEAVSEYNNQRGISDEVLDVPVDLSLLDDVAIRGVIAQQGAFNSKQGLEISPHQGEEVDLNIEESDADATTKAEGNQEKKQSNFADKETGDDTKKWANQIRTYYQRLLFYAFLTKNNVTSLDDIIRTMLDGANERLARHLYLDPHIVEKVKEQMDPFKRSALDYKIQNISMLANDETVPPIERALTSLKKFNRMSESEIITPTNVCEDMVNLIPEEGYRDILQRGDNILDIASKAGEYAVATYQKLISSGYEHEAIKNRIYSIPTSSIAYEFTRKFYEILGLNIDNIAAEFNSYDLLDLDRGKVDYERIKGILNQDKPFNKIRLNDLVKEGGATVEFGVIIGNPPYQISDNQSGKGSAKPLYHHFVGLSKEVSTEYTALITPSVWFVGGKGLTGFRRAMIKDSSLQKLTHFSTSQDVFPQVNLRGGVSYFLMDSKYDNTMQGIHIKSLRNGEIVSDGYHSGHTTFDEFFIPDNIAVRLLNRLVKEGLFPESEKSKQLLMNHISVRNPYRIETTFVKSRKFHKSSEGMRRPIKLYASHGHTGFIERDLIKQYEDSIPKWKVLTSFSNNIGTNLPDDNLNSIVAEPDSVCTETFLVVGADLSLDKKGCANIQKYLKTRFVRFMISIAKANQNGTRKTYRYVPLQDFTDESDIDWTRSIDAIDEQLFDKYGLSKEERTHIKNSIKAM